MPYVVLAQNTPTCSTLIQEAINQASINCAATEAGSACYGYNEAHAVAGQQEAFTQIGNIVDLASLSAIQTLPVDLQNGTLGVSVLNVQAGLPAAFDQSLVVLLVGGAEVENAVANAFVVPQDAISLTTIAETDLMASASTPSQPLDYVATIPDGAAVQADGISADGNWLRVMYQDMVGWISKAAVDAAADVSGLVEMSAADRTAMQSFNIRSAGSSDCVDAPTTVLVQSPKHAPVNMTVNGVMIRLQSTAFFQLSGNTLTVGTLYGLMRINPGTANEVVVAPGFTYQISLGGGSTSSAVVESAAQAPVVVTQSTLSSLSLRSASTSTNLLNYAVSMPRLVQASGVGDPGTTINFNDPASVAEAKRACQLHLLPYATCIVLFPGGW